MLEHCKPSGPDELTMADFGRRIGVANRRCEPRLAVDRQILIMPFFLGAGLRFQPARLVDCSRRGVGILLPVPLPMQEQFMIKAKLKELVLLMYTVKNCHGTAEGYRIGARFAGIIGPSDDRDPSVVLDALLEGDDA